MRISSTDFKKTILQMMNDNYREFVKALISIERGIENEESLDKIYFKFMENDQAQLVDEWFYGTQNIQ